MNLPESVTLANALDVRNAGVAACQSLGNGATFTVNAAALQRFDSSLISALLEWQRAAKAQGVSLSLQGMSEPVLSRLKALAASYGVRELLPVGA